MKNHTEIMEIKSDKPLKNIIKQIINYSTDEIHNTYIIDIMKPSGSEYLGYTEHLDRNVKSKATSNIKEILKVLKDIRDKIDDDTREAEKILKDQLNETEQIKIDIKNNWVETKEIDIEIMVLQDLESTYRDKIKNTQTIRKKILESDSSKQNISCTSSSNTESSDAKSSNTKSSDAKSSDENSDDYKRFVNVVKQYNNMKVIWIVFYKKYK